MNMHDIILDKIKDLVATVGTLDAGREKAVIMTKLDEARHWLRDLMEKTLDQGN